MKSGFRVCTEVHTVMCSYCSYVSSVPISEILSHCLQLTKNPSIQLSKLHILLASVRNSHSILVHIFVFWAQIYNHLNISFVKLKPYQGYLPVFFKAVNVGQRVCRKSASEVGFEGFRNTPFPFMAVQRFGCLYFFLLPYCSHPAAGERGPSLVSMHLSQA